LLSLVRTSPSSLCGSMLGTQRTFWTSAGAQVCQ
jgi:hypothetical protein